QIELFGPPSQVWTYSGERLNYELKNTNNNRHRGGERELTFATAFHRKRDCTTRLSLIANDKEDPIAEWAAYMLRFDRGDLRGTVGAEVQDRYDNTAATALQNRKPTKTRAEHYGALYDAFVRARPDIAIRRAHYERGNTPVLESKIYPVREVQLRGRVFSASSFKDSIVKACVTENGTLVERVGEIIDLWDHVQPTLDGTTVLNTFAHMRWYKASPVFAPRSVKLWTEKFPHMDVEVHVQDEYLDRQAIIPVSDIQCHCARMTAKVDGDPAWLTIGLER
ncbi:hypothetical protein FRC07_013257, partial [Ceratobasidium sp. 392]